RRRRWPADRRRRAAARRTLGARAVGDAVTAPAIRLENLTVAYRRHPAVHHVSGAFAPGSMTAVVGPNGAGKTTLLRALMGELRPDEGRIDRGGIDPRAIAYLPQQASLDRHFPLACAEVVAMGHWGRVGPFRRIAGE